MRHARHWIRHSGTSVGNPELGRTIGKRGKSITYIDPYVIYYVSYSDNIYIYIFKFITLFIKSAHQPMVTWRARVWLWPEPTVFDDSFYDAVVRLLAECLADWAQGGRLIGVVIVPP